MKRSAFKRRLPVGRITWSYLIDAGKDGNGRRKHVFKGGFGRKLDETKNADLKTKGEALLHKLASDVTNRCRTVDMTKLTGAK